MKRLLSLALLMASLSVSAQTIHQEGFVRSVGRPENKNGVRLAGAILRVAGDHNKVQSDSLGQFDLVFDGKREGRDAFTFSSIYLPGYDIPENKIYGPYAISTTVPVELVLVPQSLKCELEERVRKQIEAIYQKKLECIRSEKDRLGEEYAHKLEQLAAEYERSDILVNQIVNHYASLDYATMDSYKAQLSILIENGELECADSLIKTVNVARLEADNLALREAAKKMNNALTSSIEQLETIYRGKADVFKLKFENDSAVYYMKKLVALDTTNVDNAWETGVFIGKYLAQYNKSVDYLKMAKRQSILQYGENHPYTAYCYSNIGIAYDSMGKYPDALECYQKSLNIIRSFYGMNHRDVVDIYNNMGVLYCHKKQYSVALATLKDAEKIGIELYGENSVEMTITYNNLGLAYHYMKDYSNALTYYTKALHIRTNICCHDPEVATIYNNIGMIYYEQGQYSQAIDCLETALKIQHEIFGETHPTVALSNHNISAIYTRMGQYSMAQVYEQKALSIDLEVLGEGHPDVAAMCRDMGIIYILKEQYLQAIDYFRKALEILDGINENDLLVSELYELMGDSYLELRQYYKALECFKTIETIQQRLVSDYELDVSENYAKMGYVYYAMGQFSMALKYYRGALEIKLAYAVGKNNQDVAICYNNIAGCYYAQEEYAHALKYFKAALKNWRLYDPNNTNVADTYKMVGLTYHFMGNDGYAIKYLRKALDIGLDVYGVNSFPIGVIYSSIGSVYNSVGKYSEALENLSKSVDILSHFVDDSDSTLKGAKGLIAQIEQKTK